MFFSLALTVREECPFLYLKEKDEKKQTSVPLERLRSADKAKRIRRLPSPETSSHSSFGF